MAKDYVIDSIPADLSTTTAAAPQEPDYDYIEAMSDAIRRDEDRRALETMSASDLKREPRRAPNSALQGAMSAGGMSMLAAMATLGGMYGSPPPRRWDPIGSSHSKTPVTESPARAAKRAARRAQGKARARNKR